MGNKNKILVPGEPPFSQKRIPHKAVDSNLQGPKQEHKQQFPKRDRVVRVAEGAGRLNSSWQMVLFLEEAGQLRGTQGVFFLLILTSPNCL